MSRRLHWHCDLQIDPLGHRGTACIGTYARTAEEDVAGHGVVARKSGSVVSTDQPIDDLWDEPPPSYNINLYSFRVPAAPRL
ncbi:MAG: hypothetical protein ACRDTH_06825 [Pseudonocardiaceae bacterium]